MADLPDWHVLGDQITQETTLGPGNSGLQTVHRVPYAIDNGPAAGAQSYVDVSPNDFTPARVQQLIETQINNLHGVAGLGQGHAGLA